METAGRFDNSTCQICRLSRFYIPLNRELDAVWVGCLPLTKLYFAIWVECVPLNGKNIVVQGETPLRTAALPTAAGMLLVYSRTADGRRNDPCVQPVLPTAAGMILAYNRTADSRRNGQHPRRQTTSAARQITSAPTNHICARQTTSAARRRMTCGSKKSG